ncbi:hypothetical protein PAPYR_13037 [Paratrimastix pyriformis]|uniref:Vegetative cell wall protein gp1-like n=1 Tax=Paratrimastix pyriformis TaxID=342808 RepID=A0ABQ8U0X6_9EUKA|nr:hypothetical protein PAPYR_13037 [Paratrimastix pyriformis]
MNSPVAAPRHAARCPDRGAPGRVQFPGAPDDLQDDPATPLARATDRGAEVEPLVGSCGRRAASASRGSRRVTSRSRAWGDLWTGPRCWMSSQRPSCANLLPPLGKGGLELLASQAPAERHMTTPPPDPRLAATRVGRAPSPLASSGPLHPPGDARVASSAFAEPSACTSSQARGYSGISRYRGPPAACSPSQPALKPAALPPRFRQGVVPPQTVVRPPQPAVPVPAAVPVAPAAPAAPTAAPTAVPTAAPAAPGPLELPLPCGLEPCSSAGRWFYTSACFRAPAEPKVPAPSVRAAALAPQPPFAWVTYAVPICELPRGLAKSPVARGAPSPVELVIGQVLGLVSGLLKALGRHLPRVEDPDVFDTVAALAMELRRLPVDDLPIDLARTLRSLLLAFGPASGAVSEHSNEPAPPVALRRYPLAL